MHFKAFDDYDVAHMILTSQSKLWVTNYMVIYPTIHHISHISRSKNSPKSDIFNRGGVYHFLDIFSNFFGTKIKIPVATSSFDSEYRCIAVQGVPATVFENFVFWALFEKVLKPLAWCFYHIFFPFFYFS